jgi:Putative beta-barrel porin 2
LSIALTWFSTTSAQDIGLSATTSVIGQYQSNIFALSEGNKPTALVDSVAEFNLRPHIKLGYEIPVSLQSLQVAAYGGYSLHRFNKQLDDVDGGISAQLKWAVGARCSGLVSASYAATPGKLEDALADTRTREDSLSYTGSAECILTPETRVRASVRQAYNRNDSAVFLNSDIDDTHFQIRTVYTGSDILRPFIGARLRWLSQPKRIAANSPVPGINAYVQEVGAGAEWSPSSYMSINAEGFFSRVTGTIARRNPDNFTGSASITWLYSAKITTKISADRDVQSSTDIGSIAYGVTSIKADVAWKATPRIDGNLMIGYANRRVERAVRGLTGTREATDDSYRWEMSILYRLTPTIDLKVTAKHFWRNANLDQLTYRNTGLSAQITYSLPSTY